MSSPQTNFRDMRAQYDMWGLEYERLNDILKNCTNGMLAVRNKPEALIPLYDCLNEFYRIIRPLMANAEITSYVSKTTGEFIEGYDDKIKVKLKKLVFDEAQRLSNFRTYEPIKKEVLDALDNAFDDLMFKRQDKGLGVKSWEWTSNETKLAKVVKGG